MAELIASFVASITMEISPWLPCGMAIGSVLLCLLLLACTPHPTKSSEREETLPSLAVPSSERRNISTTSSHTAQGLRSALTHPQIILIIPVILVGIFRYTTLDVVIQYASVRFGMKISSGALFYTETAALNIFLFLFLIPQTTAYLQKAHQVRPQTMDLVLVRTSVILMCIGCLAIGFAPSRNLLPFGKTSQSHNCYPPHEKFSCMY